MILYQKMFFLLLLYEVSLYIPTYLFQTLDCNAVYFCTENFIHPHFLIVCTSQCLRMFAIFKVLLLYAEQNKYQTCFCSRNMKVNICVTEF